MSHNNSTWLQTWLSCNLLTRPGIQLLFLLVEMCFKKRKERKQTKDTAQSDMFPAPLGQFLVPEPLRWSRWKGDCTQLWKFDQHFPTPPCLEQPTLIFQGQGRGFCCLAHGWSRFLSTGGCEATRHRSTLGVLPIYTNNRRHTFKSFTHLTGMQAVETCWSRELTLIKLMIRKLPEQTVDGGHPPGAFVAASGRESASDWVVSLGKRRFPSDSHLDPPFDHAFLTFKAVTECLCVHT